MREALVLMAKAPVEGTVKTRLIGKFTPAEATELYINFLCDTFALMEDIWYEREDLSLVLGYTPEGEEEAFEQVEREGCLMLSQRGENLGERLEHCFAELFGAGFERVVAIGADSPTLPAEYLFEAFERLSDDGVAVLGPTEDGGFYAIGLRRLRPGLLAGIPWSTERVFPAVEARLREMGLRPAHLPAHFDVDTPDDLARLEATFAVEREAAPRTRRYLKAWSKRD